MKWAAGIIACFFLSGVSAGDLDAEVQETIRQFSGVKHPYKYSELYRSLFAAAGPDEGLRQLQGHADDSIAVQAAWEAVALTVPSSEGDTIYRPNRGQLRWFLGFVHGRTRIAPPDWWSKSVLGARAHRRDHIVPARPPRKLYRYAGFDSVGCPQDASVERDGRSIIYRVGDDKITIPDDLLHHLDDEHLWCNISGRFTDDHCFLAIHDEVGSPHDVACVDRTSGRLVWRATACGCFWMNATGMHESCVSMIPAADDRVFVFGVASVGFYLHGFRASDGKSLIFFSSKF